MSKLTKLIPALSKKNLAKAASSAAKSLVPAPVSAAWNALTQKKTGATPQYPTVTTSGPIFNAGGQPVGVPSHIIEDLLGKFKDATGWNTVGKWLGGREHAGPDGRRRPLPDPGDRHADDCPVAAGA